MKDSRNGSDSLEDAITAMLHGLAGGYDVDPDRFTKTVRPLIRNARLIDILPGSTIRGRSGIRTELHMDAPLVPFEELFESLPSADALALLEGHEPIELSKRIEFGHKLADPLACFYDLSDWEQSLTAFLKHQTNGISSLIDTGYSEESFRVSLWFDRMLGCLYPVKYRFDRPGAPWRKKTGFGEFGFGDEVGYKDAVYFEFLEKADARDLDSNGIREKMHTFRELALSRLLDFLRKRTPERIGVQKALKIAAECLGQGIRILRKKDVEFLRKIDSFYTDYRGMLPTYGDTKLPLLAGGIHDLATVVQQITMELAIRPRSDIRARLSPFKAEPPRVGLALDLMDILHDYAVSKGGDFDRLFRAWEVGRQERKRYCKRFWADVDRVLRTDELWSIDPTIAGEGAQPARKVVIKMNLKSRQIWIDGVEVHLNARKHKKFDALATFVREQVKTGKPVPSYRIVRWAGAPRDYTVYDLFKKTPIQAYLRSVKKGFYSLDIDLKQSSVQ